MVQIGKEVIISEDVSMRDSDNYMIISSDHTMTAPIRIGNHVWIGVNVTILKGVTICDGAIIAPGALVVKDVPPKCLAARVSAKVIKTDVEWTDPKWD